MGGLIDAHHHLWDLAAGTPSWLMHAPMEPIRRTYALRDLADHAAAAGVARTVLVQTVHEHQETARFLRTARDSTGLIAGVVGWLDLQVPDVPERLAALRASPGGHLLVGIRHLVQDEPDPDWLSRAQVRRGLSAVGAAGLVFDVLVRPPQWASALELARGQPDVALVLDHAGKPPVASKQLASWRAWVAAMAACPNVSVKLSGLVTQADWHRWTIADLRPVAETLLDVFGADRVMAGSDWPVCELAAGYRQVWESVDDLLAPASAAERSAVEAGTASAVYRLGPG